MRPFHAHLKWQPGGDWPRSARRRGGVLTAVLSPISGAWVEKGEVDFRVAFSFCSPADMWDRKRGNALALDRLDGIAQRPGPAFVATFSVGDRERPLAAQVATWVRTEAHSAGPLRAALPRWVRDAIREGWLASSAVVEGAL